MSVAAVAAFAWSVWAARAPMDSLQRDLACAATWSVSVVRSCLRPRRMMVEGMPSDDCVWKP